MKYTKDVDVPIALDHVSISVASVEKNSDVSTGRPLLIAAGFPVTAELGFYALLVALV